jgi:putative transposase
VKFVFIAKRRVVLLVACAADGNPVPLQAKCAAAPIRGPIQQLTVPAPMVESGIVRSTNRAGNVWDNAAMESLFLSLETERTARKSDRTKNEAKTEVFDWIERFYNTSRLIGNVSPVGFERKLGLA